ncbi:hypothetical protein Sjap_003479 [Stephania japonica]|uniref:Uncharacterized protein n=1 Tax=Stephania japonica TaxID=461633 RepID=A0AAP0KR96_9MAGN
MGNDTVYYATGNRSPHHTPQWRIDNPKQEQLPYNGEYNPLTKEQQHLKETTSFTNKTTNLQLNI